MIDQINAVFEAGGAVLLWLNVRRLLRDKRVEGISLVPTVWWTAWGFWNVYYYHALGQVWSRAGGIGVVIANCVWVGLALWYRWRERRRCRVDRLIKRTVRDNRELLRELGKPVCGHYVCCALRDAGQLGRESCARG